MELDQLRHALGVLRHGGFTAAAGELGLSQSALSRSVQRLEEELGRPLFERKARGVEPTEAGRLVAARAAQILKLADDTRAEITDDGQTGEVRVGAIPTVAPYFLPGLLRSFAADFPQARVSIQEDTTDRLLRRCDQGELDVLVLALPVAAKYLQADALFDEELFLLLPAGHPLAAAEAVTLDDVRPHPFILLGEAHCLSEQVLTFCRSRQVQPLSVERTSQLATVQELVALGHGLSLVPAMARRLDDSPSRAYRSLSPEPPRRTIAAVWNPDRFQSRLCQAFRERLARHRP